LESLGDIVICLSRLKAKINRNFEVFTLTDIWAVLTQPVPDRGAQMVRYYGWSPVAPRSERATKFPRSGPVSLSLASGLNVQ
jgi:hypothetical protein